MRWSLFAKDGTCAYADDDFSLFKMLVFKKGVEVIKGVLRELRYTVRPFVYDPHEAQRNRELKESLDKKRKKLWSFLIMWCKTTYADVVSKWVHIKAMRVFVEAVLRFGLPVDFQATLVEPRHGQEAKLRKALAATYANLANAASQTVEDETNGMDIGGLGGGAFYPYVSLDVDISE